MCFFVVRPTEKQRGAGPHKSESEKTTNKKKSRFKNKKLRRGNTQLRKGSVEINSDGKNILQQSLFYTNKDLKSWPFIDTGTSIPIISWKFTKNRSHTISNKPISGCSIYSGNN